VKFGRFCLGKLGAALRFQVLLLASLPAADWPMLGRDHTHNAVSLEKNAPLDWHVKRGARRVVGDKVVEEYADDLNIAWRARISGNYSVPVVSGGLVWLRFSRASCATRTSNNSDLCRRHQGSCKTGSPGLFDA
jgi:hypothetical protein